MQIKMPQKSQPPLFDRRVILCLFVVFALFSVVMFFITRISRQLPAARSSEDWSAEDLKEVAHKLRAGGLVDQAVATYEAYLEKGSVGRAERSNIYYTIGEILFNVNRYEDALGYFMKSETANPNTGLKKEIGNYVVMCLEHLGKNLDAAYQLENRASLGGEMRKEKASGEVVAKIGVREITMGELNETIGKMPAWIKEEAAKDDSVKLQFLQSYVFQELLYEKGLKLGFHRDPDVRAQVEDVTRQLVVEKVLKQEVTDQIKVDPQDVENYYAAYKERYVTPPRLRFRSIAVSEQVEAENLLQQIRAGGDFSELARTHSLDEATREEGGMFPGWIYQKGTLPGMQFSENVRTKLFQEPTGKPFILSDADGIYVAEVTEKEDARPLAFEEAQEYVQADYRREKEMRFSQRLLGGMLQTKEVQIFADKFNVQEEVDAVGGEAGETNDAGTTEE